MNSLRDLGSNAALYLLKRRIGLATRGVNLQDTNANDNQVMAVVLPPPPPTKPYDQLEGITISNSIDRPTRDLVSAIISTSAQLYDDHQTTIAGARVALEVVSRRDEDQIQVSC